MSEDRSDRHDWRVPPRASLTGEIEVYRSGEVYVVQRGQTGILVSPDADQNDEPTPVGSILAHVHVSEPWERTTDYGDMTERVEAAKAVLATGTEPDAEGP